MLDSRKRDKKDYAKLAGLAVGGTALASAGIFGGTKAVKALRKTKGKGLVKKAVNVKGYNRNGNYIAASRSRRRVRTTPNVKVPNQAPNKDVVLTPKNTTSREMARVEGSLTRGKRLDINNDNLVTMTNKEYNTAKVKRRLDIINSNPTLNQLLTTANKGRKNLRDSGSYLNTRRSDLTNIKDRTENLVNKAIRTEGKARNAVKSLFDRVNPDLGSKIKQAKTTGKGFVFSPKKAANSSTRESVKRNVAVSRDELTRRLNKERKLGNYSSGVNLLTLG